MDPYVPEFLRKLKGKGVGKIIFLIAIPVFAIVGMLLLFLRRRRTAR